MQTQERTQFSNVGFRTYSLRQKLLLIIQNPDRYRSEMEGLLSKYKTAVQNYSGSSGCFHPARPRLPEKAHSRAQAHPESCTLLTKTSMLRIGMRVTHVADQASLIVERPAEAENKDSQGMNTAS